MIIMVIVAFAVSAVFAIIGYRLGDRRGFGSGFAAGYATGNDHAAATYVQMMAARPVRTITAPIDDRPLAVRSAERRAALVSSNPEPTAFDALVMPPRRSHRPAESKSAESTWHGWRPV